MDAETAKRQKDSLWNNSTKEVRALCVACIKEAQPFEHLRSLRKEDKSVLDITLPYNQSDRDSLRLKDLITSR